MIPLTPPGQEPKWRYIDDETQQAWAVRATGLEGVFELWIRVADDLPGECLIMPRQHAHFLARVLAAV